MTTTVSTVYQRAAALLGWRIGTLGTVTVGASTTTAILNGLIGTTGSNVAYAGYRLIFPSSTSGSQEAFVQSWVDATGTATFANQTSAPVAGQPYILVPATDYTLNELNLAWADTLRQARRTYRQVIPITPNERFQNLAVLDWLRGTGDVDQVSWNISPIALHNEDFALWQNGGSLAPDGWTLSGAGASITRTDGGFRSAYKATVTADGGAAAELTQSMPKTLVQWIARRTAPVYVPIRGAAWLETSNASSVRVGVRVTEAGVTSTTWSDYVTADGRPYFPELSYTPNVNVTDITLVLQAAAGTTFSASATVLMQNTATAGNSFQLRDQGSQFYSEAIPNYRLRNLGGVPTIEFERWPNVMGQIIVYSRRPYPQTTLLSDTIEDEYVEVMKWGLIAWLLRSNKPNQDRSRLDRIMLDAQREWARFLDNVVTLPVGSPPVQVNVGGA
jgi:hypothetical protein